MSSKIVAAILITVQAVSAQVIGNMYGPGIVGQNLVAAEAVALGAMGPGMVPYGPANALPYPANTLAYEVAAPILGCGFGLTLAELSGNGGGFAVTSTSPFAPTGVSVQSEDLAFEGPLAVTGTMPFLGSVSLEGPLPAAGQGAVAYGCGNGNVGILTEELPGVAVNNYAGPGPAMPGYNCMGPRGQFGPMY